MLGGGEFRDTQPCLLDSVHRPMTGRSYPPADMGCVSVADMGCVSAAHQRTGDSETPPPLNATASATHSGPSL